MLKTPFWPNQFLKQNFSKFSASVRLKKRRNLKKKQKKRVLLKENKLKKKNKEKMIF